MFTFTKEQKKLLGKFYSNRMHPAYDQVELNRLDRQLAKQMKSTDDLLIRKLFKCVSRIERTNPFTRFPQPYMINGLINYWGRDSRDGESWREVFIFETQTNTEGLAEFLEYEGYDLDGTQGNVPAGHAFQFPAIISQLTDTRFLVEMRGGLNV